MLQGLAKAKALKELQALVNSKASLNGLALAKALKRQNELRLDLGMGKVVQDEPIIKTPLNIDEKQTPKERRKAVESWLKENLQGKAITTVDGKKVFFNRSDSVEHLVFDSRYSLLAGKAISYIAEVFSTGRFVEREPLNKERKDKFVAFHTYEKQVEIDSKKVLLQAKAGEKADGTLQTLDTLIAYHQKIKAILDGADNKKGHFLPSIKSMDLNGELALGGNYNIMLDSLQDEYATLTILQVLDENGTDITDEVLGDGWDGNDQAAKADLSILQVSDDPVQVVNYVYKQAQKQYSGKKPKEITVRSDGSVVLLGWQGIKHALSKNANETIALATTCIEQLIENAVLVNPMENKPKGKKERTEQNMAYVKQTLLYKSILQEKSKNTEIGIIVKVLADGSRVYDYFTLNMKKAPNGISGETNQPAVNRSFEKSITKTENNVNSEDGWDGNDKIPQNSQPFNRTNIKIPKSIKARQNANNQAMAILDRLDGGELSVDDLTDDDKAVLAKYSGNGGGLIGRDGKKGSDYEYYTPHELASGMWDLAKELGFDGGRVLDPCAGTGVFTATSPDNVLMDNIELDETSGRINQILNDGVRAKTTVSPFEKVVNGYDDGDDETGFDLVMSNVPFGNNAARGANKMYDKAYQDASLDYYFILRSLEKLKSGGLAVLMTAPSTVQGKRAKEIELRQKTSRIAEFIGAYRLPNSMFTDTGADVSVDVMVFKKFNQSMIETVQNHYDNGNIELLQQANVLWDDYLSGHYFKKHPKNVLGTIQKAKNRFGDDIEVVQSELSKSQIAKLMVKLGGSRIDWELLNATEAKPITYQNGDVVYRGGVQYQYQHGTWQEMTQAGDDIRHHDTLAKLQDSHNAMNVSYDDIKTALAYFAKKGVVNEQINDAKVLLSNIKDGVEWRIYHTSKAIDSVLAQAEIGANFKEIYPGLSDEMRDVVVLAKGRYQGMISNALKNIKLHYNKGDYSDVWNGNIQKAHDTLEVTGTLSAKIAKLQYNNKSKYLSMNDFKAIAPDVDLMTDDDYFITKDGKQVILAQDFLVGNCKERLDELNRWIDECDDEALKTKLSRQWVMASLQIPNVDIYKANFDLLSPQIPMSFKMDFLNSVMPIKIALDGKGLKMMGSAKSNSEKIANRILYNINGNRLTLGGIELTDKGEKMNEKQALKLLNETFLQYNAQFKSWVKANDTLIDLLDSKINSLDNCYFSQNDDEGELDIHGFNVKLHGYQNAFVRQQGRSFGGLNGFGVGLGKTFTSLASVQHTHNIGAKKKTIFVVPKSVLSNWRKEAMKAYASLDDCLFVGLREVRGKMVAKSSEYDADLQKALSREYRKIFMTQEAFARIKLQDDTLDGYFAHLAQNDDIYNAQESE